MRDDVVEVPYERMTPELRALIAYEPNGALDLAMPQPILDRIRQETPVVRWELGVGFFAMDDIVATTAGCSTRCSRRRRWHYSSLTSARWPTN